MTARVAWVVLVGLSCGGAPSRPDVAPTAPGSADAGVVEPEPLVLARPYVLTGPLLAPDAEPLPLVVLLHGYTMTAQAQDAALRLSPLARQRRFWLALPEGLRDASNHPYWNATDACCAFGKTNDDVAWLAAVIRDVKRRNPVDPRRVFVIGYSNGGFMAHRLACDLADVVAGIVSLAGSTWEDASKCRPSEPVAVLQVHGTDDAIIPFDGGATFGPAFPSAETTVRRWARANGCQREVLTSLPDPLDLDTGLPGDETVRAAAEGCPPNAPAELWTIRGGTHLPTLSDSFSVKAFDWLARHPKP